MWGVWVCVGLEHCNFQAGPVLRMTESCKVERAVSGYMALIPPLSV